MTFTFATRPRAERQAEPLRRLARGEKINDQPDWPNVAEAALADLPRDVRWTAEQMLDPGSGRTDRSTTLRWAAEQDGGQSPLRPLARPR